jgi:hypothetical protein
MASSSTFVSVPSIKNLITDMLMWVDRVEELQTCIENAADAEIKTASELVYREYLARLHRKTGQLFFHLSNIPDVSPFEKEEDLPSTR